MEHGDYQIDIINSRAEVIGQKLRRNVDKKRDVYHAVFVIVATPEKDVVLAKIPVRYDLPNLYGHSLGATAATIRRHSETALQAAQRCLAKELFIEPSDPQLLDEGWFQLDDGRTTYATVFCQQAPAPTAHSGADIESLKVIPAHQLTQALATHPGDFAPTLRVFWQNFSNEILNKK